MAQEDFKRKLTAILSADVKGYSRLMGEDEVATVKTLTTHREAMTALIQQQRGRVVDSPGDNLLAEFSSVVDAVQCAVEIQQVLRAKNADLPENRRVVFRIGVNLGDVIVEGDRIYGDGINIAARIESLAEPGGICISRSVYDQIKKKLMLDYKYMGEHSVKNISEPVRVYRVPMEPEAITEMSEKRWGKIEKWQKIALSAVLAIILGAAAILFSYLRPSPPAIEPAAVEKMAYPLPDKPSIAVLPFVNMSNDPEQNYIADGISENIITALSYIPEMFVIARNSTFVYKGKPVGVQQVAEKLGVRYVLEGSVQKSGDRLRVTSQLIDATTGHHLWAERYDRHLKDLFALQDEITLKILTALEVELTDGEDVRDWNATTNLEAWGQVQKGARLFERFTKEDNAKARAFFERAVKIDPQYAGAWVMLAWTHAIDVWLGSGESPAGSVQQAVECAGKAGVLTATHPNLHSLWNFIYLIRGQHAKAITEGEKSVTRAPSSALNHILFANTMLLTGKFEQAVELAEKAMRLAPYYADWYLWILAQSYRQAGRYKEALEAFKEGLDRSLKDKGNPFPATIGMVDVCVELGREETARQYAAEVLRMVPNFSVEDFRKMSGYKNPAHIERIVVNLRKAGLK